MKRVSLFRKSLTFAVVLVCTLAAVTALASDATPFKVLLFTKTLGYRHPSISNGIAAIRNLAQTNNFQVTATEDASLFTDNNLAAYQVVVFLSTTGDVLNDSQQNALTRFIQNGHGFVGVHAACDTEYNWPWFGSLLGAYYKAHPAVQYATVHVEDSSHPSTSFLPLNWVRNDEWYDYSLNPRTNDPSIHVLATVDESTYQGGQMKSDHPIAWYHEYSGGRAWYTGGGHTPESFAEPLFLLHLLGGIKYAAGARAFPPPTIQAINSDQTVHLTFTNLSAGHFSILMSTNSASTDWTVVGTATQLTNSIYQWSSPASSNAPQAYYQLRSP